MKRFKALWKGALPLFLAFWAAMMAILAWLNLQTQEERISRLVSSARRDVERSYEEIWTGGAEEERKTMILTWRLASQTLWEYHGFAVFRVYDGSGEELARSQLAQGTACPFGTGVYSWYLQLDPVLSEEEQLALAELLRGEPLLGDFRGTAGGVYEAGERTGLYCEVTGVVDEERQVIYPRTITYVYEDHTVTLVDSDSDFFAGKEEETLQFDAVWLSSALVGVRSSPKELLGYYRQAEEKLERLLEGGKPSLNRVSSSSDGSSCAPIGGEAVLASSYTCAPVRTALMGLGPVTVLTLLAAVAAALSIDRRQRETLRRERAFTRAAAHELKTPLAVLRAHAESLKEDIDPAKREEYLDVVLSETDRMTALTGALLDLARLEQGEALVREPVELSALVKGVFDRLALPLEQKGIEWKLELSPVWTEGDRVRLESVADNLASNALRHGVSGGRLTVTLAEKGGKAVLTVDNDGEAVPEDQLARLWEPFYRGDRSRGRDTGGTGLGLAIVRAVVKAHGGDCAVSNRDGGVIFRVWLPGLQSDQ
ncbi:MAG TPA: HAMP domain-containing histidine kinase [Candidatus Flavonifractor merdavium]|nr:HAMP domain-containing histidine kinase [Candidatus Flavonifractor merdavium]